MSKIVRGNIDPEQIKGSCRQGDSGIIQMAGAGGFTDGNVLIYDANGNAIDSGVAPGSGITYPGDATKFLDGTGNFTVPSGGGGADPLFPWATPSSPDLTTGWAWENSSVGTSISSVAGAVQFTLAPSTGMRVYSRAVPSTPFTATVALLFCGDNNSGGGEFGIGFSDGAGKYSVWRPLVLGNSGGLRRGTIVWTGYGSGYSDDNFGSTLLAPAGCVPVLLRVEDDGTTFRTFRYSWDFGRSWILERTQGRAYSFTTTKLCLYFSNPSGSIDMNVSVLNFGLGLTP